MIKIISKTEIIYPSSDREPVAETYLHLYTQLRQTQTQLQREIEEKEAVKEQLLEMEARLEQYRQQLGKL